MDAPAPPARAAALRAQAHADLGCRSLGDRLRQHQVLRPLDREAGPDLGRPARRHQEHLRAARHPRGRAPAPRRRRRRPVRVRGGLPPDQRGARAPGRHLHGHRHGAEGAPRVLRGVLRHRHPGRRQQVRRAQHRRLVGRLVRLRAAGRARRDPAAGLLPHQHREHGPVRAHADHRRRGQLRALHRGLHRADLQERLAALGRRRDHREEERARSLHDDPELVEQRLQPRHQARHGRRGRHHGVDRRQHRLEGHDEVPVDLPHGRARQGRDPLGRLRGPRPAPGRRRQDDPHGAVHAVVDRLEVDRPRRRPRRLPRRGAHRRERAPLGEHRALRRPARRHDLALRHLPGHRHPRRRRAARPRGHGLEGQRRAALLPDVAAACPKTRPWP